jgi:hypothetical protein
MASLDDVRGYDESRFKDRVRAELFCSICQEVLKNPQACENKEHTFCRACILLHLGNSHTCPECRENLSPETLKNPPRFLMNCLSDLRIFCDYRSRGCPEDVRLENLPIHVDQCEFAPVECGRCGVVVNRKDKDKQECQEHITLKPLEPRMKCYESEKTEVSTDDLVPKCHECKDIKRNQEKMEVEMARVKELQDDIKARQGQMIVELGEVKDQMLGVERKQHDVHAKVTRLSVSITTNITLRIYTEVLKVLLSSQLLQFLQKRMNKGGTCQNIIYVENFLFHTRYA